jgi:L-aminopeptidase/D-esterase-like protein
VALTPVQAKRVAIMAQDGLARSIRPVHSPFDGDAVFALSTARQACPEPANLTVARLGALAADTLARAVARAVHEATPWPGSDVACWRDLPA